MSLRASVRKWPFFRNRAAEAVQRDYGLVRKVAEENPEFRREVRAAMAGLRRNPEYREATGILVTVTAQALLAASHVDMLSGSQGAFEIEDCGGDCSQLWYHRVDGWWKPIGVPIPNRTLIFVVEHTRWWFGPWNYGRDEKTVPVADTLKKLLVVVHGELAARIQGTLDAPELRAARAIFRKDPPVSGADELERDLDNPDAAIADWLEYWDRVERGDFEARSLRRKASKYADALSPDAHNLFLGQSI